MALVKEPVPVPSDVLLFAVVGFCAVLQHTPFAVTVAPPSDVIFPPDAAVVCVTEEAAVVLGTGTAADVVK